MSHARTTVHAPRVSQTLALVSGSDTHHIHYPHPTNRYIEVFRRLRKRHR